MTSLAFILGVIPLLRASGAGAQARRVLGTTVFSGMLIATILGVLLIPALYVLIEGKKKSAVPVAPVNGTDEPDTTTHHA
jgi:HAE1 family hydrophobic/amphiphilic exporter-1